MVAAAVAVLGSGTERHPESGLTPLSTAIAVGCMATATGF